MKSVFRIEKEFTGGLIKAEMASPVPPVPGGVKHARLWIIGG